MSKIKTLQLKDFQSHSDSTLEFSPLVNAIVGPSDSGKTAIWRALRYLYLSEPKRGLDNYVRLGKENFQIDLETEVGKVRRVKGKKNQLTITRGKEEFQLSKIGSSLTPELLPKLIAVTGIEPAKLDDGQELILHAVHQLDPPFLLSETGPAVGRIFSRLGSLYQIEQLTQGLLTEKRAKQRQANEATNQQQELTYQLEKYSQLETQEEKLQIAEQRLTILVESKTRLETLKSIQDRMNIIRQRWSMLPLINPIDCTFYTFVEARHNVKRIKELQNLQNQLQKLDKITLKELPRVAFDFTELRKSWEKYNQLKLQQSYLQNGVKGQERNVAAEVLIQNKLIELDQQYHSLLKLLGKCPTCKQTIS